MSDGDMERKDIDKKLKKRNVTEGKSKKGNVAK